MGHTHNTTFTLTGYKVVYVDMICVILFLGLHVKSLYIMTGSPMKMNK